MAARHAGVRRLAAPLQVLLANEVAAHLVGLDISVDNLATREVFHWQAAHVIGHIGDHRSTEHGEILDRGVFVQHAAIALHRIHDFPAVMELRHLMTVDNDGFDLLGTHNGTDAATSRNTRRSALRVGEGDAGDQPAILPDRPANTQADLRAEFFVQHRGRLKSALAHIRLSGHVLDLAFFRDVHHHPIVGLPVKGEAGKLKLAERETECAARIGFLDPTG